LHHISKINRKQNVPGDNEGISLKRPVAQRGSILLAELVAILMVLEHCIAALKDGFTDIKILSDS
jgi:hypothetical protein